MTTVNIRGFTIIELMLFLAVSGGLFAALLLGVNNGVVQQRYKDSVYSYSSFLQNQYSEVLNTRNEARTGNGYKCGTPGVEVASSPSETQPRGASDCVILGRAIEVENTSAEETQITSYKVIGQTPAVANEDSNDIDAITSYSPKITTEQSETTKISWGSRLSSPSAGGSTSLSPGPVATFLILRSPMSGLIKAFTSTGEIPANLRDLINTPGSNSNSVTSCVINANKGLIPTHSVILDPSIAGPSAITVKGDGSGC